MRSSIIFGVFAAVTLASAAAVASPAFPNEIQKHLGLTYSPQCSLCHAGGLTGFGTVTTPFGKAMRDRGLTAGNVASLDTVLDRMAADNVDSNRDGVTDIDELKAGTDPNANAPGAAPPPEFGCGVTSPRAPTSRWAWAAAAIAGSLLVTRRRTQAARLVA